MEWNVNGSLMGLISKDKKMHVFDPRQSTGAMTTQAHQSSKGQKLQWIGDGSKILTVGFSEYNERQYAIYDIRGNFNTPLAMKKLDNHNLQMHSYFDRHTGLLYVVNRLSNFTQFFHFNEESGTPDLTALEKYQSKENQLYMYFMPKKTVDFMGCEIQRAIRITSKQAEWITFKLPRKSGNFQDDLYPPCEAGKEAHSYEDWAGG
jgi:hypothetical protein